MLFDLNMWKNQIFYHPSLHGQYVSGPSSRVRTVANQTLLMAGDPRLWSREAREEVDPNTGRTFMEGEENLLKQQQK